MPSYAYTDGDGLSVLDKTKPDGATEPVSSLDDALKQVKAYLRDTVGGGAKLRADATQAMADITALDGRVDTLETTATEGAAEVAALTAAQAATQAEVDALQVVAGSPANLIAVMNATQDFAQNATIAVVNFNVASVNPGGGFNSSSHVYTVPVAGLYQVNAALLVSIPTSSSPTDIKHYLSIVVNGLGAATKVIPMGTDTSTLVIDISRLFQLAATNTIQIFYQATTASGTLTARVALETTGSIFQAARVSA